MRRAEVTRHPRLVWIRQLRRRVRLRDDGQPRLADGRHSRRHRTGTGGAYDSRNRRVGRYLLRRRLPTLRTALRVKARQLDVVAQKLAPTISLGQLDRTLQRLTVHHRSSRQRLHVTDVYRLIRRNVHTPDIVCTGKDLRGLCHRRGRRRHRLGRWGWSCLRCTGGHHHAQHH